VSSLLIRLVRQADPSTLEGTGYSDWSELKRASLAQAVLDLRSRLGDEPDDWRWGRWHTVTFAHVFGQVRPLARIFSRGPYPIGGDFDTPHQASSGSGNPSVCDLIPTYRQIVDLGDLSRSVWVIPGGQSGLVGSRHYDDQLPLWRDGRYLRMLYDRREILDDLDHLLVLRPKQEP
jgi:penicillin amidase